ncbi:CHAT domain-containing protein [Aureispira anguillae]|uniref:CHAT domain-containing protein n=1 Tax=Aureispira anguillae TaxID=2864201 RepID=A0A915YFQ9_9BACT|nr:CHAT domain-containing protein [Aureispira anguillae]BDS12195.1 CHAT domain-containing protein [Aureispira anguillae]
MYTMRSYYFVVLSILCFTTTNLLGQRTTMTDFLLAYNLGAYNRATSLGEELLLRKSTQNKVELWFPLTTKLGIAYHYLGNYNRGLERLELAIDWAKNESNYSPNDLLLAYSEKGKILKELERLVEAQISFAKAVALFEQNKTLEQDSNSKKLYLDALMGMGYTVYAQKKYTKTKAYFEKALAFNDENVKDMALLAQAHLYLGRVEEKLGNASLAGEHMFTAIKMGEMERIEQDVVWSTFYRDLAAYYIAYKRDKEALAYNDFAIQSLLPSWKGKEEGKLPTVNELNQSASLGLMAEILAQRGAIYFGRKNSLESLKSALDNYRLMDVFITRLRRLYTGETARLLWSDRALDFYKKAIKSCLILYQKTNNERYKMEAFELSERSKSLLLLEAFKKIKAKKIAGVPIEKIQKEEELEYAVDELDNELYVLKQNRRKGEEYKNELREKEKALLEKRQIYEDFLIQLRKQHPAYYKLKFDLKVASVEEVRERLAADQTLIEYFIGDDELIVFRIDKRGYDILELPIDFDLKSNIKQFREGIYGYYLGKQGRSDSLRNAYLEQYKRLGRDLYRAILEPVLTKTANNRLMIIPAGNLGFLPFEALLTKPAKGNNLKKMPYLLNKYAVGYCYSATLLHEMQTKEHVPRKIFLGFAPEFDPEVTLEGQYNFNPLIHTKKEVADIFDIIEMNGKVFNGSMATKENFQQNCEDYCIVHIATHGVMNAQKSENSFLAFSEVPDSNDNELLYVRDLYNMHLTASLVVLSACETGVGELHESEGIASLARGFSYAGAKSLITSLWSVNDHATAVIMRSLYENLKMGMPKDEALRDAKLNFIQNARKQSAHPFLWSAFIQIGDEAPLPQRENATEEGFGGLFWGGIGALLVILGLFVGRYFMGKWKK